MKTYVFIARRICEIGGAEQYLYNKSKYLESQGWRVLVFSGREGNILISGFEQYKNDIYPALTYAPECFSKREVKKTIDNIVARIGDCEGDTCIIESDAVNRAIWAEIIASRLNAKHLAFILQEEHNYDLPIRKFLRFKYDRHELAGIAQQSINQMLGDETIERRLDTKISAYCQNVVDECEDSYSCMLDSNAMYTIGSVGRLEKPCVTEILNSMKHYFSVHKDIKFNLVLIGGAVREKTIQQIFDEMHKYDNVNLIITGNIYPIPASLLKNVDVFVSTAGSASMTYKYCYPTVRVHPVTGQAVGVIGLDFKDQEKSMYDITADLTIEECIDKALNNANLIEYEKPLDESYYKRMYAEFDRQICIGSSVCSYEYYNEEFLMQIKTTHISSHFLHWLSGHLIGGGGHAAIRRFQKRLQKWKK